MHGTMSLPWSLMLPRLMQSFNKWNEWWQGIRGGLRNADRNAQTGSNCHDSSINVDFQLHIALVACREKNTFKKIWKSHV